MNVPPQTDVKSPRIVRRGRSKRQKLISTVLVSAFALSAIGIFIACRKPAARAKQQKIQEIAATEAPVAVASASRWRVFPFDNSYSLKPGDTVVVHRNGESKLQQVAANPNEAVLLKRGAALDGIYMAGESGYVVISDRDGKIVSVREITATIEPAGEREH